MEVITDAETILSAAAILMANEEGRYSALSILLRISVRASRLDVVVCKLLALPGRVVRVLHREIFERRRLILAQRAMK